jgi:hypothetical protein
LPADAFLQAVEDSVDDAVHALDVDEADHGSRAAADFHEAAFDHVGGAQLAPEVPGEAEEAQQFGQVALQPPYLAATAGGGLPQLTRVLVSCGANVVMEPTLDEALTRIFGGTVATVRQRPPRAGAPDIQALIHEANQHFERAQQLLRQGDFARYGEENRKSGQAWNRRSSLAK